MAEKSGGDPDDSDGKTRRKDNDMKAAMVAVSSGEMTISVTARVFSVHRKTLYNRVKGLVAHGTKPGRSTVLTS